MLKMSKRVLIENNFCVISNIVFYLQRVSVCSVLSKRVAISYPAHHSSEFHIDLCWQMAELKQLFLIIPDTLV